MDPPRRVLKRAHAAIDECKDVTELLSVLRFIWVLVAFLKLAGL